MSSFRMSMMAMAAMSMMVTMMVTTTMLRVSALPPPPPPLPPKSSLGSSSKSFPSPSPPRIPPPPPSNFNHRPGDDTTGSGGGGGNGDDFGLTSLVDPDLPFGDINVVVITDLHTWFGGHSRQEPYNDVDMGHVLSFYERLKEHCDSHNQDLWFVNNGDFIHGTGLHRVAGGRSNNDDDPSHVIPLIEKMPYDVVNCGNHELYTAANVEYMTRPGGYVDWWGDKYITSNVMRKDGVTPLSVGGGRENGKYKILEGKNSRLLVFGFLYDMGDESTSEVVVKTVEDTVQEQWYHDALREEHYDAILVMAHMDLVDPLVTAIQNSIRSLIGQGTPVVFITGHTHYRGVKQLEDLTMTFEAGRYLDTVGFVSFPGKESVRSDNASGLFHHKFIDTNQKVLFHDTLGFRGSIDEAMTSNGKQLSAFIDTTRKQLGLEEVVGCAPHPYFIEKPLHEPDSLWKFYRDDVIPDIFMGSHRQAVLDNDGDNEMAMLVSTNAFRYNLYANASVTVDDIIAVAPFNDTIVYLGRFPSFSILKLNDTLNEKTQDPQKLPAFVMIGDILYEEENSKKHKLYHLYSHEWDVPRVERVLKDISGKSTTPFKTEFQSTMTLMAYVTENWPCKNGGGGGGGKLPDWFPTPQKMAQKSNQENSKEEFVAVLMITAIIGLVVLCVYFGSIIFHKLFSQAYQPIIVVRDEIESFGTNRYSDDDDDGDENDGVMKDNSIALPHVHTQFGTPGNKSFADAEDMELADADHDASYRRPYITGLQ